MKKLLYLFLAVLIVACTTDDNNNVPANCDVVYLDANGVTIKACPDAEVGVTGEVNGVTYTVVDEDMLREMIGSGGDVTKTATTKVTDMFFMFKENESFNQDISSWDVSNVTNMFFMFKGAVNFNQDISRWDVSKVTDMSYMFEETFVFNQDLSAWNVTNVTNCEDFSYGTTVWILPQPNFTNCTP